MKIHYHSDNQSWAASEQMLLVFFQNLMEKHDVTFSYRYSPRYVDGRWKWTEKAGLEKQPICYPLISPITKVFKYRWLRGGLKYYFSLKDIQLLKGILDSVKPDIVHINNGGHPGAISCHAMAYAAKSMNIPVLMMCNAVEDRPTWKKYYERPIDYLAKKNVDAFVTASTENQSNLFNTLYPTYYHVEKYITAGYKPIFRAIPNTIHEHHDQIPPEQVRKDLGIGPSDVLICSVGVFEERKGVKYIVEAFKRLELKFDVNNRHHLLLIGSGSLESEFRNTKRGLNVHFLDDSLNAYSYINACDIYAYHPVYSEDFSLTMLMAMKCGKPIVASNITGNKDMITHGLNGFLMELKDVDNFARSLKFLIEHPDTAKSFGNRVRKKFEKEYSEDVVIGKYLKLYEELLK